MGQTLTHGVYLPDEGERNCYSGLAANWQILDTAVGTIAAHTAALAGKAPLAHTHTVSQITDFPAYGNAAGTICEGNDSRLSDARTPVAHTHTKSDITDLFNSANMWSESNTFSKECSIYNSDNSGSVAAIRLRNSKAGVTSSGNENSTQAISFADKNNFTCTRIMCGVYLSTVVNRLLAAAKDTNGNSVETELQISSSSNGTKAIFPTSDADVNLGNSAHRWKTLNNINPGALSIFNPSASYDPIDIPTSWDTSGASWNTLSVSNVGDGWIYLTYYNCSAGDYILARFGGTNGSNYPSLRFDAVKASDNKYYIYALFPVAKACSKIYFKMLINSNANLTLHHYIPAYGTV